LTNSYARMYTSSVQLWRRQSLFYSALPLLALAMLAAACAGGPTPVSVAHLGAHHAPGQSSGNGKNSSSSSLASETTEALAYARCIRAHGVPSYPDPKLMTVDGETGLGIPGPHDFADKPGWSAAERDCQKLDPLQSSLSPTQQDQRELSELLAFATCMRAHGVRNYPDPTLGPDGVPRSSAPLTDPAVPGYGRASRDCLPHLLGG
jgi:hypothetical protein